MNTKSLVDKHCYLACVGIFLCVFGKIREQTRKREKENACISLKLKRIRNAYYASIGGILPQFIFVGVALVL